MGDGGQRESETIAELRLSRVQTRGGRCAWSELFWNLRACNGHRRKGEGVNVPHISRFTSLLSPYQSLTAPQAVESQQ